jgi:hypothetical protein
MSSNDTSTPGTASTPSRNASGAELARLRPIVRIGSVFAAIGYITLSQTGVIDDIRVWAQMRPPAIIELSQYGVQRGKTTTITVDGQNLIEADAVVFDDARISGKIVSRREKGRVEIRRVEGSTAALINDIADKTELIVEMTVPDSVEPGTHGFRVRTPLGTTALRTFAVGLLPELDETEMNDEPDGSQAMTLPMTANGALQRGGDVDHYWFEAKAGQQIVFALTGTPIGSRIDSTVTVLDASGATIASNDDGTWQMRDSLLVHTFAKDGRYAVRIADALDAGGPRDFHYRLTAGELPYVTSVFPLGGARDSVTRFAIEGVHLGTTATAKPTAAATPASVRLADPREHALATPHPALSPQAGRGVQDASTAVKHSPSPPQGERAGVRGHAGIALHVTPPIPDTTRVKTASQTDTLALKLTTADGTTALNEPRVARGIDPEIVETVALSGAPAGQVVTWPITINGRITSAASTKAGGTDTYRIRARKGQRVVLSVAAERLGSPLDAVIEVLDSAGKPIPRAIVRPVWETSVDLRDHSSTQASMRLLSTSGLRRGDYVFVDRELMQIRELPKGPDEDTPLTQFRGRRISFEGTSGESHANTRPVYKVEIHPPGTKLSPNGLPLFTLTNRNDDGGPLYGKDPYLDFTAPADGEYVVRLADTRGRGGRDFAYRLTIAPPRPDFTVFLNPTNPNVPRGSRVPVTVTAFRHDGFDGPIHVKLTGLPSGVEASPGVILPGHTNVAITVSASEDAAAATSPFSVIAEGRIDAGRTTRAARAAGDANAAGAAAQTTVTRTPDLERALPLVTVTTPPDVRVVSVEPKVIELEPGKRATVHAKIARGNGFTGRVPLNVLNLPFRVTVPNTGLNGILITEQQDGRDFIIEADPAAAPLEQTLYVTARAEVNSAEPNERASTPIILRILPAASGTPTASASASLPK